ncbi:BT_3987 domain-containing protein [Capnocytophaga leadbetteri]|uniref:BT_3987 domain-containing protein n=1 Tax=Capnocytophaga leadbetteri TaxID=327575 RepID=UPI003C710F23
MKRIITNSFVVALGMVALVACKKDEITIQKNDNVNWQIDEEIVNDDIRTRIGYDPRFEYALPAASVVENPMLSLEGFTITDKSTRTIEVKLSRPSAQDVKISLVYDATLYDEVKNKYIGYELGDASLAELTTVEKIITAGTTTTTFEIKVANKSNFNKKVILPFAVKVSNNDNVKTMGGKNLFVIKIFPKDVTFEVANSNILKEAVVKDDGITYMTDKEVGVTVTPSDVIPSTISLGLVRDNGLVTDTTNQTLAPNNIIATINKVDFKNIAKGTISFTLQNIETLTTKGKYVLPLKLMAYDASGTAHQVLDTPILVTIDVSSDGVPSDNDITRIRNYNGSYISPSKYSFYTNYQSGHIYKMHDGDVMGNPWWIDTSIQDAYIQVVFTEKTVINGIKIYQRTPGKRIQEMQVYASPSATDPYVLQGIYSETYNPSIIILKFDKPIKTDELYIGYFKNSQNQYIDIHEMVFF